jgi:hypothetical protein
MIYEPVLAADKLLTTTGYSAMLTAPIICNGACFFFGEEYEERQESSNGGQPTHLFALNSVQDRTLYILFLGDVKWSKF